MRNCDRMNNRSGVERRERYDRIKENLDLVEGQANYILSQSIAHVEGWHAYRDDMIGAGEEALVAEAARYSGAAFRQWARLKIGTAMRQEIHRLRETTTVVNDEGKRVRRGRKISGPRHDIPVSHDTEDQILGRIDRARSLDLDWQLRERHVSLPVLEWYGRMTPVEREIWRRRRVWNQALTRVAQILHLTAWDVRKIENDLIARVT